MKSGGKYYKLFCLAFALGLTLIATNDILFEVGHFMSHAHGYILNGTPLHSHQSHNDNHSHQLLDKIGNLTSTVNDHQATTPPSSKELVTVDQIKLICHDQKVNPISKSKKDLEYPYQMGKDQIYISFSAPPPKFS